MAPEQITPAYIRYLLRVRNISQTQLATELDVQPAHISLVLSGRRWSDRVLRHLADTVQIPYHTLSQAYRRLYEDHLRRELSKAS